MTELSVTPRTELPCSIEQLYKHYRRMPDRLSYEEVVGSAASSSSKAVASPSATVTGPTATPRR
jgi:hypothetical protein